MSWTCSHGCTYSDFEMEMGMSWATLNWLAEQEELAYHLEADQKREAELARAHAAGESDHPWPWYTDAPSEVEHPQVFGP